MYVVLIYSKGEAPLGIWGSWSFWLAIFIYFTREMESFLFSPQDRLYFHYALWPFIYFTHFPHKLFISKKKLQSPQCSNGGPLTYKWTSLCSRMISERLLGVRGVYTLQVGLSAFFYATVI